MEGVFPEGRLGRGVILPPRQLELGAHFDGQGTNFAVYASDAASVSLVLVSADRQRITECEFAEHRGHVWGGYVSGVEPGQRYGYRVDGPWAPWRGLRHNRNKVLLDPYARAIDGSVNWNESLLDFDPAVGVHRRSEVDSLPSCPLGIVANPHFDWGDERLPHVESRDLLIYETHVRGFTRRYPLAAKDKGMAGTYAALGLPAVGRHLRRIGATSVELLPVQAFLFGKTRNYWGYNPIGYFAPEPGYAQSRDPLLAITEFKQMVKALHEQDLEVIIDVVYNHTLEGGDGGPSLSFRGLDNRTYYLLGDNGHYLDWTGCGNTINAGHPQVLKLILDSLRYWVEEMHVDGFRFDEAPVLGRNQSGDFEAGAAFFAALHADPVLSKVRLIAEPWDCFPTSRGQSRNAYQLGGFPAPWAEWNGFYRDRVRDFWRARLPGVADLARCLSGSEDIFRYGDRGPVASVNMITCHDGFTLRDLVSYEQKHNFANGEDNRDGVNDNRSWNGGIEGDVSLDNPSGQAISELRARQQRNFLATLFLSVGTPMLLGGDELNRTQGGNNNPYNQDNEISWFDWAASDPQLLRFVETLAQLRKQSAVLRRQEFLRGRSSGVGPNCLWFTEDGTEIGEDDWRWRDNQRKSLAMFLDGKAIGERDGEGREITGDSLLVLMHAGPQDVDWKLPSQCGDWEIILNTADPDAQAKGDAVGAGSSLKVLSRSLVVLRQTGQG